MSCCFYFFPTGTTFTAFTSYYAYFGVAQCSDLVFPGLQRLHCRFALSLPTHRDETWLKSAVGLSIPGRLHWLYFLLPLCIYFLLLY
jgi:hypothetical protein